MSKSCQQSWLTWRIHTETHLRSDVRAVRRLVGRLLLDPVETYQGHVVSTCESDIDDWWVAAELPVPVPHEDIAKPTTIAIVIDLTAII